MSLGERFQQKRLEREKKVALRGGAKKAPTASTNSSDLDRKKKQSADLATLGKMLSAGVKGGDYGKKFGGLDLGKVRINKGANDL
jgi:uncharacterized protein YdaU (DUF1376 family)